MKTCFEKSEHNVSQIAQHMKFRKGKKEAEKNAFYTRAIQNILVPFFFILNTVDQSYAHTHTMRRNFISILATVSTALKLCANVTILRCSLNK